MPRVLLGMIVVVEGSVELGRRLVSLSEMAMAERQV
jgi:hypothetical protein